MLPIAVEHGMLRLPILGYCCLVAFIAIPNAAGSTEFPEHCYYFDEKVPLELVTDRLAVQYRDDVVESRRATIAEDTGISVRSTESVGIGTWTSLELAAPIFDLADANTAIRDLTSAPEIIFASPVFETPHGGTVIPTPAILVRFRADARRDARRILDTSPGVRILRGDVTIMTGYYQLESTASSGLEVLAQANRLAELPETEWAEPDMILTLHPSVSPNDPLFPNQWEHRNQGPLGGLRDHDMTSEIAWEISGGDPSIEVLVMDNGMEQTHPDLNQLPGMDFTSEGGDGSPHHQCDNHGTAVAGCISAILDNGLGVVGVAPAVRTVSARIAISPDTTPCPSAWTSQASWIASAILWGYDQGIEITNASFGGGGGNSVVRGAFATTRRLGMVHFASAGNNSNPEVLFPARFAEVNAIAATNKDGERASFSNYGPDLAYSAPGDAIPTTDRTGSAGYTGDDYTSSFGGTSAASPHAAGVAALALSMNPDRNYLRLRRVLQRTSRDLGDPGKDDDFGRGFVSANSTVRFPTRRVTFRSTGEEADGASRNPALNANGRFTVFASDATNLRGNDTNSASDCFVHDRDTARTLPLTVNSSGEQANGASDRPGISGDGARVVFDSDATNLTTDTNTQTDVFLHDRDPDGNGVLDEGNATTVRVSVATGGAEAVGGPSTHGVVSDDGNFVLFTSAATNLVGSDGNGVADIFFHDVVGVTTTRVSLDTGGGDPDGASSGPDLSTDMAVATFASEATDLIASDGNLVQDVFVHDLVGMTTERVSVATGGAEATGWSGEPSISGDGNLVAFSSDATDLITGDGNGRRDVFLRDRLANTTVRVSVASGGGEFTGDSSHPSISDDGTQVAFQSDAPELGGTPGVPRVYVHDLTTGITMLVSRYDLSHEGPGTGPVVSGDGTTVAFESDDSSMTPNDGNTARDVYLFQDTPCDPPVITTHPSDALDVPIGTTVTFSVAATGTQAFYQWRKDGLAIPRAIGVDYAVEVSSVGDQATYDCVVTNFCGAETSVGAILTLDATGAGETARGLPSELLLEPAAPNPFVASTSFRFAVPQPGPVLVTVYDVAGRRVATLWNGPRDAGWHRAEWFGTDDHGHEAATGVYFLRVETREHVSQHKVVRLN